MNKHTHIHIYARVSLRLLSLSMYRAHRAVRFPPSWPPRGPSLSTSTIQPWEQLHAPFNSFSSFFRSLALALDCYISNVSGNSTTWRTAISLFATREGVWVILCTFDRLCDSISIYWISAIILINFKRTTCAFLLIWNENILNSFKWVIARIFSIHLVLYLIFYTSDIFYKCNFTNFIRAKLYDGAVILCESVKIVITLEEKICENYIHSL